VGPVRPANGASGAPSMPPGFAAPTAGVAALAVVAGNDVATGLNAGAADAQLCGTDSVPTDVALPSPAVTAALPRLGEASMPEPLPNAGLSAGKLVPNMLTAGPTVRISEPAEPNMDAPEAPSDADEPVPDARLAPEVRAVDDVVRPVNAVTGELAEDDVDEAVSGVVAASGIDIAEVSGDTVCALVPAEVAAACPTAAACPANPAGLVLGSGGMNGVNVDAVCDAAA
jgi:hypothetical protein